MMRDECWKDALSLEPEKMIPIQTSTGSQYLTSDCSFGTGNVNRELPAAATSNV